jgi:hypothetical protein
MAKRKGPKYRVAITEHAADPFASCKLYVHDQYTADITGAGTETLIALARDLRAGVKLKSTEKVPAAGGV